MEGQTLLFLKLTLLIGRSSATHCDRATTAQVREGNLGQSGDFKWLGVLHVHLPEWDKVRVAISGIVLIRIKYALANADDVVRIPPNIFKKNSKAMFLAARDTPWYGKPASYIAHPEYEYSTLNTIAVVELNLGDSNDFPLTPICLPTPDTFNASRYLYLMGFTDDNEMLEKVIYKIQYVDNTACEEFYNRTVVPSVQLTPSAYLCGYAPNSVTQCVWENGMVLVSNATGSYDLIGFGIHGPGCAAPARFIDLFPYFSWINSVITPDEVYDDGDGLTRMKEANKFIPNVPIQELYTKKGSRRFYDALDHHRFESYPFNVDALKFHLVEPSMEDKDTLLIIPFNDTWQEHEGACSKPALLMYEEYFELKAEPGIEGTAIYKLSLYDRAHATCSCVRLTIDCRERSGAILSFKEKINLKENTEFAENSWETPEEILKYFPINERTEKPKTKLEFKDDKLLSESSHVKDKDIFPRTVMNYDLYIKFEFTARAVMKFEMFAKPFNRSVGWLLPTTTTSKITTTTTTMTETSTITETTTLSETSETTSEKSETATTTETSETAATTETSESTSETSEATSDKSETATTTETSETATTTETSESTSETSEATSEKSETATTTETSETATTTETSGSKSETSETATTTETSGSKSETSEATSEKSETATTTETSETATTTETSESSTKTETSESTSETSEATSEKSETATTTETSEVTSETPETTSETSETTTPAEVATTTEPVRRRAKSRVKKRLRSHWGMVNWANKMLKEAEISVVAAVEEVQESESAARREGAPGPVVVICWLVRAGLRRVFFVY